MQKRLPGLAIAIGLGFCALAANAQGTFPNKPIRLIVPYPAGGIVDVVSRVITEKLGPMWGQTIITEARPGANSNIGTDAVAKAPADGYTWLITGPAITANPALGTNATWDPKKDFTALGVAAWSAAVIVVPASSPAGSLKEFVALAKTRPLNYGNPGSGSSIHLSTELFKQIAGINLQAIGYKGQPQIVSDLLGGQLDVAFAATGLITQHVQGGKLKALGVIGRERLKQLPHVPTLIEAGYPEAGVMAWYTFFTRAGAPREVIEKINADLARVLTMPDVKEKMEKLGAEAAQPLSLADMSKMISADTDRWAAVIKAGNIKAE